MILKKNILNITFFETNKYGLYVNSKWELQKEPFKWDVVNSYNDGPLEDGKQLGPFYEIESSYAARELKKGESQIYTQVTYHFEGLYLALNKLSQQLLNVNLDDVK